MRSVGAVSITAAMALAVIFFSVGGAEAAKISGIVVDSNRSPVPGATVTLYQDGRVASAQGNPATTDFEGRFEFPILPPGDYSVQVEKSIFTYSASVSLGGSDCALDVILSGYTSGSGLPTPPIATRPPLTGPTAPISRPPTSAPPITATPTPKPTGTPIPLPPQTSEDGAWPRIPGFEAVAALVAIGIALSAGRYK